LRPACALTHCDQGPSCHAGPDTLSQLSLLRKSDATIAGAPSHWLNVSTFEGAAAPSYTPSCGPAKALDIAIAIAHTSPTAALRAREGNDGFWMDFGLEMKSEGCTISNLSVVVVMTAGSGHSNSRATLSAIERSGKPLQANVVAGRQNLITSCLRRCKGKEIPVCYQRRCQGLVRRAFPVRGRSHSACLTARTPPGWRAGQALAAHS
jgi:hypothetical protein